MLQAMRNNTRIILWVTVIAFVLLIFLVWGADLSLNKGHKPGVIGSVNGQPIMVSDYQALVAQNRQMASQNRELQPSDYLRIEEDSWDALVEETLLRQEAAREGIRVHDAEVKTVLLENPPPMFRQSPTFQNDKGQFDVNLYRSALRNASSDQLLAMEAMVRNSLPLEKLQANLVSAAKVTDDEVRRNWLETSEKAKASWVLIPLPTVSGTDPGDAELQTYFDSHKDDYKLPRRADVNYVTVPRKASAADSASLVADLRDFRKEALDAARSEATGDENLASSDFETLVMTFSQGPNAAQGGLSTGFLSPVEMTPAMRRAVENLPVDSVSEPFQDGVFYHIVQVVDDTTATPEGATGPERRIQIRDLALRIGPSDSTVSEIRNQLDEAKNLAQSSGLAAAAEKHGLTVQSQAGVTASGLAGALSSIPNLASFALHNPKGTVSRVYEINNAWFLLEIAEVKEPGYPTFEEAKQRVIFDAKRERQFDLSKRVADQLSGRVKMGQTLEDASAQDSITVNVSPEFTRSSGVPSLNRENEPELVGAAFSIPVGQVSAPIKTGSGWVLIRVDERPEVDEAQYTQQAPMIRMNLTRAKQNQLYQAWIEELRAKANIKDFRT